MLTASVVIPAYEAEAFVGRAVRSALAQTLRDIEVIVVDDGSRDATCAAALVAAEGDARLQVIRRTTNGGVSAARNVAFAAARGRWIALLDADDAMAPDRLARLVAAGEERDADLIADHVLLVRDGAARERLFAIPQRYANEPLDARTFVALDGPTRPIGFMKPLLRRAFVERHGLRYPEDIDAGEDFHLYVRALMHGARVYCLPDAGYEATARDGSLSRSDSERTVATFARSTELLIAEAQRLGQQPLARRLARRAVDLRSYGAYDRLSDAMRHRRVAEAALMLCRLALRTYLWRRLAAALGRRVRPA